MAELQRGVVKWFNDAKGFGFIEHTSGRDVFVHYSVIEWDGFKTLKDGEEVHYELSEGDKGLHASKVVRLVPSEEAESEDTGDGHSLGGPTVTSPNSVIPEMEVEHSAQAGENNVTPSVERGPQQHESLEKQ